MVTICKGVTIVNLPQIAESASFPCEVCNLRFDDARSAVRHSAAVHIADPRKRLVVCDLCLRVFPNSFQVRRTAFCHVDV